MDSISVVDHKGLVGGCGSVQGGQGGYSSWQGEHALQGVEWS